MPKLELSKVRALEGSSSRKFELFRDIDQRREGEPVPEIIAQIRDDPEIGVLVLGAGTDKKGPGPLVTQLSRSSGSLTIPITIVPGDLSKERLEAIT